MNSVARILVVDDDPALRELLHAYLTDTGFAVELAGDGVQMRRAMEHTRPDAIVMDLMMPGEDGLSLTRQLRASAATATIPVLMLSARGEEIDRVVGLEMGADDYLAKPFSPRELLARLRALLRRAHAGTPEPQEANRFGPYRLDPPHIDCSRTIRTPACRPPSTICSRYSSSVRIGC
jgi:DNA-binding response OmpR family regulator